MKNTPWEKYDEDEDLPGWVKSALQVEVGRAYKPVVEVCFLYFKRTDKFKKVFGDFSWVCVNPGNKTPGLEKSNLGIMVDRQTAVQLYLGRMQLSGLLDADKKVLLDMELDAKGGVNQ